MTINERIIEKLQSVFPGKVINILAEVDPMFFNVRATLCVNGERTQYGYMVEQMQDNLALFGMDKVVDDFVNMVTSTKNL